MSEIKRDKAYFHLPGLFEFYDFYQVFLPLFYNHRDFFYDWCEIGSIYGAPADCLWAGGRLSLGINRAEQIKQLMDSYSISSRLTFSNSLLKSCHLDDVKCNELCRIFENENNGIIIHSDLLLEYLRKKYPSFYYVSSTTKVLTDFNELLDEVNREEFLMVVADFRLNRSFSELKKLQQWQKDKIEFLCNECCFFGCNNRKKCYENVSRQNLDENCPDFVCTAPDGNEGYRFSKAMNNPGFIGVNDIKNVYMAMGYTNFKIEGRGLGSALLLEFILYYMTKPEYQINVREEIYLDSMLDLF